MMKLKNEKGITLIALVITIIVLLILAAVTIATLTGENGILNQATRAGEENNKAKVKEQVKLEVMGSYLDNGKFDMDKLKDNLKENLKITEVGDTGEGENRKLKFEVDGNEIKVNNRGEISIIDKETGIYQLSSTIDGQKKSTKNNPIIPEGFKPIDEGEAKWGDGNQAPEKKSVDNGLVIEDIDHNQFVWVPVPDIIKFKRVAGYLGGSKQSWSETQYTEPYKSENSTEESEYNKMYESVRTNGGFYIGRYEAGIEGGELKQDTKDTSKYYWESGKVVVKKGVQVYNWIGWSNSSDMKNEKGGAVEKAKEFKKGKAYENSVTSTLIYGIQWDTTMQFFDNRYIEGIPTDDITNSYVSNSVEKGNYNGKTAETGSSVNYAVKNIYDMAGNVTEWTMEAYNMNGRVDRGGFYNNEGSNCTASRRSTNYPFAFFDTVGFRIALYVG